MSPPGQRARDRDVLLLLGAVVLGVLVVEAASAALPAVGALLAGVPVVLVGLVLGTAVVLLRALRPR